MCSLCGILGNEGHWTESGIHSGVFASRQLTHTSIRERQDRTRLVNRILKHYGLTLEDWAGSAYILKTYTGRTQIVQNLAEIWAAAEALTGRSCDPLDDNLLKNLAASDGD